MTGWKEEEGRRGITFDIGKPLCEFSGPPDLALKEGETGRVHGLDGLRETVGGALVRLLHGQLKADVQVAAV